MISATPAPWELATCSSALVTIVEHRLARPAASGCPSTVVTAFGACPSTPSTEISASMAGKIASTA